MVYSYLFNILRYLNNVRKKLFDQLSSVFKEQRLYKVIKTAKSPLICLQTFTAVPHALVGHTSYTTLAQLINPFV